MSLQSQYETLLKQLQSVLENTPALSDDVLRRFVTQTMRKYQDRINIGIQDSMAGILDNFKQQLHQKINISTVRSDELLLPSRCRYAFTKSDTTIFVIEEYPQVRSLLLEGLDKVDRYYRLAMPYSVFVVSIKPNATSLFLGWRTSNIKGLDDDLNITILPNQHRNLLICMPSMEQEKDESSGEFADRLIHEFWLSSFNDDLDILWNDKDKIDERLTSATAWEELSDKNPSFPLELSLTKVSTIRELVDNLTQETEEESKKRHEAIDIVDEAIKEMSRRIFKYLNSLSVERVCPKDLEQILSHALHGLTKEIAATTTLVESFAQEAPKLTIIGEAWKPYESK